MSVILDLGMGSVVGDTPPTRRIVLKVSDSLDGAWIQICTWNGIDSNHAHANYRLAPGFVVAVGDDVPVEAIQGGFIAWHSYFRMGDECLIPINGILPDGTFDRDILTPDDTIRKQGTITSKEYEEKYRPWNDGVPGTMTEEEEERYRRLGAMSPQRIRRTVGKA